MPSNMIVRALGTALALQVSMTCAAKAADVVVTSYGGLWEKATRECFVKEFEKRTGKTAEVVLGNATQWINQIAANPAKPPVDVMVNNIDEVLDANRRGIVEPFDIKNVPRLPELEPALVAVGYGNGATVAYSSMGIAYNTKTVKHPPKSWKEFVDGTMKGEWQAAIPDINYVSTLGHTLWLFANVYGGGVKDFDPGFKTIRDMYKSKNLQFWSDPNAFLNLLKTGDIDIGMYWEGRTLAFKDQGNPDIAFINPLPGAVVNTAVVQKVKNGSPLGWEFIDVMMSPEPQACFGNIMQYRVSNTKARMKPEIEAKLTKMETILLPPYEQIVPQNAALVERWNKEIKR